MGDSELMFKTMTEEKFKNKCQDYVRSKNCEKLQPTWVNGEIWTKLRGQARSNDIKLQKLQTGIIKATIPALQVANTLLKVKQGEA